MRFPKLLPFAGKRLRHMPIDRSEVPARQPIGEPMISCPQCYRLNPAWLVYCESRECVAVLHPERAVCGACRSQIPVNARFCPDCGQPVGG